MVPDAPYCGHPDYGSVTLAPQRGGRCEDCWHRHLAGQRQVAFAKADDALKSQLHTTMALIATVPDHHGNPQTITIRWDADEDAQPGRRNPKWIIESSCPYPDEDHSAIPDYASRLHSPYDGSAIDKARIRAGYILDYQLHDYQEQWEAAWAQQQAPDPETPENAQRLAELAAQDLTRAQKLQAQAEADYLSLPTN